MFFYLDINLKFLFISLKGHYNDHSRKDNEKYIEIYISSHMQKY